MSEKRKIEHFFQEQFSHHEMVPPEEIWSAIELELKKKKEKKRVVPFWWKLSGIAALLVIGYGLYNSFSDVKTVPNNLPPTQEKVVQKNNAPELKKQSNQAIDWVTTEEKPTTEPAQNSTSNSTSSKGTTIVSSGKNNKSITASKKNENSANKNPFNRSSMQQLASNSSNQSSIQQQNKTTPDPISSENKMTTAAVSNQTKTTENTFENQYKNNKTIAELRPNSNLNEPSSSNNGAKETIKKVDSTAIAHVEPNALEELLKEKESTQKQKMNRWLVTPNVAPIYFGSLSNGSPLDESLRNNTKNYNTSMSYGLSVSYAITKKTSIRTGVNVLSLNYDTQGIVFYQDTQAQMMRNIAPTPQGMYIQIRPLNNVSSYLSRVATERFDGVLNQRMGYVEMPVEMTYKLLNRKFGIDLSGGISTLFLNENEIFLKSDGYNRKIGTATNLNEVHFSTNLGLGLRYAIFKNFDARIEPSFRYQINTFSADSGSFKPYLFGIYSGISYKF